MIDLGLATQNSTLTDTMAHNFQGFSSDQLSQQQRQQQPQMNNLGNNDLLGGGMGSQQQQGINSFSNSSGISPSMLLPNQPFAALLQPGGGGGNGGTGLADQSEGSGSHPQQNLGAGGNLNGGFDINSELKRLQQLQQQMNQGQSQINALISNPSNSMGNTGNVMSMMGGGTNPGNTSSSSSSQQQPQQELQGSSGAMNPTSMNNQAAMNNQNALLQQMIEQQKMQTTMNNQFMGAGNAGFATGNNLLGTQSALLGDPRLFLAQSQFGGLPNLAGQEPLPAPHALFSRDGSRRMRGGVIEPFPEKLHRLLLEVEAAGRSDVISFVANGRAFAIHKPDKFFKEIVPLYFRQSRLSSFKRQLNLYGFELINTGPSRGGYFHELFVKDRPEMCRRMRRVAVKVSSNGKNNDNSNTKDSSSASQQQQQQQQQQLPTFDAQQQQGSGNNATEHNPF